MSLKKESCKFQKPTGRGKVPHLSCIIRLSRFDSRLLLRPAGAQAGVPQAATNAWEEGG